ncbi:hypothetical protein BRADI_1g72185v3 [Brachypodium distachyon]|uniref:Uncharacterized protein n=1 Tax=Brachypodium distachyon TaxID=15368 RepID=A0A0Q3K0B8_BRADI|nr:hypothetical protein BRADI_1g72185v3 [Brachypodium distachyon]KQK23243.1 hypothetical protein BRADI_1g72185v3 [Brachypodium distachyon]
MGRTFVSSVSPSRPRPLPSPIQCRRPPLHRSNSGAAPSSPWFQRHCHALLCPDPTPPPRPPIPGSDDTAGSTLGTSSRLPGAQRPSRRPSPRLLLPLQRPEGPAAAPSKATSRNCDSPWRLRDAVSSARSLATVSGGNGLRPRQRPYLRRGTTAAAWPCATVRHKT